MKLTLKGKRIVNGFLLFSLLSSSFLAITVGSYKPQSIRSEAAGYTPQQVSVPTTLYLKHSSENDVRNYYKSLNNLASNELKGFNLLKNLKPILKNNSTYVDYNSVWQTSCITDRDWKRSPIDSIPKDSYDPTTMTVTGYKDSWKFKNNGGDDPYLIVLYRNDNGSHNITINSMHNPSVGVGGLNKEHVWPQSRGFKAQYPDQPTGPAGTDVHHLIIADAIVNQATHNNLPYGEVSKPSANQPDAKYAVMGDYNGTEETYVVGNYRGTNGTESQEVFEPLQEHKGDIARAIFYMVARYNNLANESGVISQYEPNLTINNTNQSLSSELSSDSQSVNLSYLKYLYKWHKEDPVDDYEIYRNDLIYNNVQKNRNPFIDFPEWVDLIWTANGENKSSTKTASPINDPVKLYGSGSTQPGGGDSGSEGGGDSGTEGGGDPVTPPTPNPGEDTNVETTFQNKETVEAGSKTTATNVKNFKEGKYFITVNSQGEKYLDSVSLPAVDTSTKLKNLKAFNHELTSGYFNIYKGTTKGNYYISNADNTKYLGYDSSTNFIISRSTPSTNFYEWNVSSSSTLTTFYFTNAATTDRAILYQTNYSRFGAYKTSNISETYLGVTLYECIYTYDVFINELKTMNCTKMEDSTFMNKLDTLYAKMNAKEKAALNNEQIVCNDGATYMAQNAYNYAKAHYFDVSNNPSPSFTNVNNNVIILVATITITTLAVAWVIVIKLNKKKNTK